MKNKPPHFLIVGAPKAGTTSLYRYLQQHPQIFMPENKEPRFFCGYTSNSFEFGTKYFHPGIVSTEADYLDLFRDAKEGAISGEASTDYLSCPHASKRIHEWNPSAKIIIILRNPVDRAYSEYQHSINAKFQTKTFWESLCLENKRIEEHYDPVFWHVRRGLYFEAVKEYIEIFGKDRVQIILFEEFANSTTSVVESLFKFLEVPPCPVDVSVRYNAGLTSNPKIKHRSLSKGLIRIIVQLIEKKIRQNKKENKNLLHLYMNNSSVQEILTKEQYDWLRENFREDILKLQVLLDINLEHWL